MKLKKANTIKKEDKRARGVKGLMEGIILQSISDLWIAGESDGCRKFFSGEGFRLCAKIAGMNLDDQVKLLNLVNRIVHLRAKRGTIQKEGENKKELFRLKTAGRRHMKLSDLSRVNSLRGVSSL